MSGWIKYFENGGKNMSFRIEDGDVFIKYNNIWNKIKDLLSGIRLSSDVICDEKYITTKVKDLEILSDYSVIILLPKKRLNISAFHALVSIAY